MVIPSYRVTDHILGVLAGLGPECTRIYVVDDACPDGSGKWVAEWCDDPRVTVLYHERNQGVGGATLTGFQRAVAEGADVIVKLDGDGQMDPRLIPALVQPILDGEADYAKGNRFYDPADVSSMPWVRLLGNLVLSFFSKLSSGYWDLFDPTNGYVAIHPLVASSLPLEKISRDYFFESDMLFRLNTLGAIVTDVPMTAHYGTEKSNLVPHKIAGSFLFRYVRNYAKRIIYNYFLRDFHLASVNLVVGTAMLTFGVVFGSVKWLESFTTGYPATSGSVMLAALPTILGTQLLLSFLAYDMRPLARPALHRRMTEPAPLQGGGRTPPSQRLRKP